MFKGLSLLTAFFVASSAFAAQVDLLVWTPSVEHAPWVLPRFTGDSDKEVVRRYLDAVFQSRPARKFFNLNNMRKIYNLLERSGPGRFTTLESSTDTEPRVVLLANSKDDYNKRTSGQQKVFLFSDHLEKAGGHAYLVPVFHDLGLSKQQAQAYRSKVIRVFDSMIAMGGADTDPRLSGDQWLGARGTHYQRDLAEARILTVFLAAAKNQAKFCLGVCRGHQLISILHGMKLHQHIPDLHLSSEIQHSDWALHKMKMKTSSLMAKLLGGLQLTVNSYHHQAVIFTEGMGLVMSGNSDDGVVEAIESTDQKILGTQFHAEYMPKLGNKFFPSLVAHIKKLKRTHRCLVAVAELITR